ncbi:serine/threonine-protein kinase [Actinoallomurus oryzae]|uniref:non-specific serine/threonine protein kinase n=1 Tax=Actinoallomurus oryzae TaxID=502180 RepID=A0ABP8PUG3_9ACTN
MTSTTGRLLDGRYRLVERIAAGGQGEVWRAEDLGLGRPAAVKLLRGEYADNAEFRERFRREAQHAAGLSHPGIAQVFDYSEGDGGEAPYLVMEYVAGESLSAAIAREAPMSVARVLDIVAAVASALASAHAAGLVHRDVKPGNVLLGGDGSIKITDFGIARAMDASSLTRTGTLMGTPLYLAPEQAIGRPATAASDLYALGIIAFELLTGRPPYEGPPTAVVLAHRDTPLPPLPSSVPPGLAGLVQALTAKDPAARPHPAAAVAEQATLLRADPGTGTRRPDETPLDQPVPGDTPLDQAVPGVRREGLTQVLDQPVPPVRRRWALPLALGGGLALLVGLVTWTAWPASDHRPAVVPSPSAAIRHPSATPTKASPRPVAKRPRHATHAPPHRGNPDKKAKRAKHGKHGKDRH